MQVQFSKMHGLGNDFMVIDNVTQNVFFSKEKIKTLSTGFEIKNIEKFEEGRLPRKLFLVASEKK